MQCESYSLVLSFTIQSLIQAQKSHLLMEQVISLTNRILKQTHLKVSYKCSY